MNDELTRGLTMLADEADPAAVDTYAVIAKAKARTRNRRAGAATAFGTVAAIGALAVTFGAGGGTPPATPTIAGPWRVCVGIDDEPCTPLTETDDRSRKLTQQLAKSPRVLPERFTVEQDGRDPAPLEFVVTNDKEKRYTAWATLLDPVDSVDISFEVGKVPAGTSIDGIPDPTFLPCTIGVRDCEARTLPDGTIARAETSNVPSAMEPITYATALRPDGTYIQVIAAVPEARPDPPFTLEELFEFATVFTY
jgi:hypothetical protein